MNDQLNTVVGLELAGLPEVLAGLQQVFQTLEALNGRANAANATLSQEVSRSIGGAVGSDPASIARANIDAAGMQAQIRSLSEQLATARKSENTGQVDDLSRQKAALSQELASIRGATTIARNQATLERIATREQLASEIETSRRGGLGGMVDQFQAGFRGRGDTPYAEQFGQAAKFSLFYGGIYRLQSELMRVTQDAYTQTVEYQKGMSDMALATGQSRQSLSGIAQSLMDTATAAGQRPSVGLEVGAKAIGLYGAASQSAERQDYVMSTSAEVASKMALLTDKPAVEILRSLSAATQELGLGVGGQAQIADLDTYFTRKFGGSRGDTLQAVAKSGALGLDAGFSLEQISAFAAAIGARTGQSSDAVGGYLSQMFAKGGNNNFLKTAAGLGIDTNQETAKIFAALAQKYDTGSDRERMAIGNTLGRGEGRNAIVALFDEWKQIQTQVGAAGTDAPGSMNKAVNIELNNLGGQAKLLIADFDRLVGLLGNSGVLDGLGLLIAGLDKGVEALNNILELWNALPGPMKSVIGVALELAAALKIAALATGTGSIGGFGRRLASRGAAETALTGAEEGALMSGSAVAAEERVGAGLAGLAKGAAMAAWPWAAAGAGLWAIGEISGGMNSLNAATKNAAEALADVRIDTAGHIKTTVASLRAQADRSADAGNWFVGHDTADADNLRRMADFYESLIGTQAASQTEGGLITPDDLTSVASLKTTVQTLGDSGLSAAQKVSALADAVAKLAGSAAQTDAPINARNLVGNLAKGLTDTKSNFLNYGGDATLKNTYGLDAIGLNKDDAFKLFGRTDFNKVAGDLQGTLAKLGIKNQSDLKPGSFDEITNALLADINTSTDNGVQGAKYELPAAAKAKLREWVANFLKGQLGSVQGQIAQIATMDPAAVTGLMDEILKEGDAQIKARGQYDFAGRDVAAQAMLRSIQQIHDGLASSGKPVQGDVFDALDKAHAAVVQVQLDRLESLHQQAIEASKQGGKGANVVNAYVSEVVNDVLKGQGSADQLAKAIADTGAAGLMLAQGSIANLLKAQQAALIVAQQAADMARAVDAATSLIPSVLLPPGAGSTAGPANNKVAEIQHAIDLLNSYQQVGKYAPHTGSGWPSASSTTKTETAAQIAAAAAEARAAADGGGVITATAALQRAQADLAAAKTDTVAYYNALAGVYKAEQALAAAAIAGNKVHNLLGGDSTDPVFKALMDAQAAYERLLNDQQNGRTGLLEQDQLDLRTAQQSAEAAAFSQRLQDAQTAENLGRMSHAAYLQYLQSEHNRLASIQNKTRQQIDELNQIDGLIKSAQQAMQGQFNFGAIKLPTPYQVRRYIEEQTAVHAGTLAASASTMVSNTTTIYVNGADTARVTQIITEVVGKNSQVTTGSPRYF